MRVQEFSTNIRLADINDAEAIAAVHVGAWRESYLGLVPAEMLASLSVDERTSRWRRILGEPDPTTMTVTFIAFGPEGDAAAFGSCGLQRSPELAAKGFDGEFQAIYVLRAAQRRGIGRGLMAAMASNLTSRGLLGSALWVLQGNETARIFYSILGGVIVGRREDKRTGGVVLHEVAYGWSRVALLVTAAS